MRIAILSTILAFLLTACASSGERGTFSGLSFGASAGGGSGLGSDSYGRRVDLDAASGTPSLPSIGTPGLGK